MPRSLRTSSYAVLITVMALAAVAVTSTGADANSDYQKTVDITFPLDGPNSYVPSFHHGRSGGRVHKATDIMAAEGLPVHAAMGGKITFITGTNGRPPSYGYMIRIAGDDGRTYSYVHLGRQTGPPSRAYAPGMAVGVRVERGQHIGFNGCSGNASCSGPHLHFQIQDPAVRDPYGTNYIDPYNSLRAAEARGDVPGAVARIALSGDWDGDGDQTAGWFQNGEFRLRYDNSDGGSDRVFRFGKRGDVPVVGDWDGDGRDTIGVFRAGEWHLRDDLEGGKATTSLRFGSRGDVPVAGDWDGDGHDTIGVFRQGQWHLRDTLTSGKADASFAYGSRSDLPVAGDWNGDGSDGVGVVRAGRWFLRNDLSSGNAEVVFDYGKAADIAVAGDWDGTRVGVGVVRPQVSRWYLRHSPSGGFAEHAFTFEG